MRLFATANGSVYQLDEENRVWARLRHEPWSDQVRTDSGNYWLAYVNEDHRLVILGPPLAGDASVRMITTSPVRDVQA